MNDLISRQAAIDALGKDPGFKVRLFGKSYDEGRPDQWFRDVYKLTTLPPEQPERKKGKWIAVTEDGDVYKRICSCCGQEAFFQNDDPDELYDGGRYELSDFCPHCGAEMSKKYIKLICKSSLFYMYEDLLSKRRQVLPL